MANVDVIADLELGMTFIPETTLTIRGEAHLETLLMQGFHSGPATLMTDADWDDIRREVQTRAARRVAKSIN